jgi:uncharacterized protein (UPF0332 family)
VEDNLRTIISRNYYACYQAARAFVLLVTKSDVDDHKKLAPVLRDCLSPANADAADTLDKWRDIRNEADYSPYPFINDLKITAHESCVETATFLDVLREEFGKRGLTIDTT